MQNPLDTLKSLRRPRLLISAARFGLTDYNRKRDLKRLFQCAAPPSPTRALGQLIETEAELEATRQAGNSTYSVTRHVEVLIALMGEARLLARVP